ncbi:MAG: ABC transporter permease [Planctomycetota bacterium]|nr:ABC transporter permease [Planctomycetota bacterium]
MILKETVINAVETLWTNRFRSVLTLLGIVIAVAAVISVVSLLEGMSRQVSGFIKGLGSDMLWIMPGREGEEMPQGELTPADASALLAGCPSVVRVAPMLQVRMKATFRGQTSLAAIIGTTTDFHEIRDWYVTVGRLLSRVDVESGRNVCIIGDDIARKLGFDANLMGRGIEIEGRLFTVVGLLERKGTFFTQTQDDIVLMPLTAAARLSGEWYSRHIGIMAQAANPELADDASGQIKSILRRRHRLAPDDPDDFRVSTQEQVLDFFHRSKKVVLVVLVGIVAISLVVGGIGIMNIMLVSVTERTREIGILKALGAREKDILMQFLLEAVLLSLAGGVIGIVAGIGISFLVAEMSPLPSPYIPMWAILLSFVFSASVGVFFGMYPAVKASMLSPVEALRYE